MPTLGEELKRRREERDISLNEISESTRIGIRFLKAIDSDNYSILPGGIFTRSFIRAYAKQVGMNEEEAMGLYNEQVGSTKPETNNLSDVAQQLNIIAAEKATRKEKKLAVKKSLSIQQPAPQPEISTPTRSVPKASTTINWGTLLLGVGILIIVGVIVTALVRQLNKASAQKQANSSVVKTEPPPPVTQEPQQGQNPPPTTTPQTPTDTPPPQTPNIPTGDAMVVKLEAATGDIWIKYQVDEAQPSQLTLRQGLTQEIPPAQNTVKINYGNRQGLKIIINNKEAYFPAAAPKFKGQVVLSRDNLQSFFQPPAAGQ
jgi:cytoskeleton protein RodZ